MIFNVDQDPVNQNWLRRPKGKGISRFATVAQAFGGRANPFHELAGSSEGGQFAAGKGGGGEPESVRFIRKVGSRFCVFSRDGKRLGCHPTKEKAQAQLGAIEASKHSRMPAGEWPSRILQSFEGRANPFHEPSGSPEGGQFAAGEGGEVSGSGKGKKFGIVADAEKLAKKLGIPKEAAQYLLEANLVGVRAVEPPQIKPSSQEAFAAQPGKRFPGKCFDKAADYILNSNVKDIKLVHGFISDGSLKIGHAWVELPGERVFDGTRQAFYQKKAYYENFRAKAERVYTSEQSLKNMLKYRHYGPWQTGEGFVSGEKGKKSE